MITKPKSDQEISSMRQGGRILATVLSVLRQSLSVGMSTKDLSLIAADELRRLGGKPAFLGYHGFPDILCTSINEEVVHGIPSSQKVLKNGDIVSLDFGVKYEGMITDAAISVVLGNTKNPDIRRLMTATELALSDGIAQLKNGCHVEDISASVQARLEKSKLGIVRDLVGHGVGHYLHEDPNIPNFGVAGQGPALSKNMTIAIEPMATLGSHSVYIAEDGWTVKTRDSSLSAHFEHTVLITETGYEILTELGS